MVVQIDAYKIAYNPLPKAACSSVKAALAIVDPTVTLTLDNMIQNEDIVHSMYQTTRFRPKQWQNFNGWWRFVVLRDPLQRLLSCYTDRVVKRRDLLKSAGLKWRDPFLPKDPDPDFFFLNLGAYMSASSVIKHHALRSALFIGPAPLRYDSVYKLEDLPQLASDLSERTQQDVVLPKFNNSGEKLALEDLGRPARRALRDYLERDYTLLADYYDSPF